MEAYIASLNRAIGSSCAFEGLAGTLGDQLSSLKQIVEQTMQLSSNLALLESSVPEGIEQRPLLTSNILKQQAFDLTHEIEQCRRIAKLEDLHSLISS